MDATARLRTSALAAWSRAVRVSHDFDIDTYYAPIEFDLAFTSNTTHAAA